MNHVFSPLITDRLKWRVNRVAEDKLTPKEIEELREEYNASQIQVLGRARGC